MILILSLLFSLSQTAKAENPACLNAIQQLETFLKSASHKCAKDSDCQSYYFRVDSWQPPVVLPKIIVTKEYETSLIPLQKKIREACAKEWESRPPTEALGALPNCVNHVCMDVSRPKGK